jgi:hypothetical protein
MPSAVHRPWSSGCTIRNGRNATGGRPYRADQFAKSVVHEGRTERTNDGLRNICDRRQHRGHGQHTHRVRKIAQAKVNELLSLMKPPSADRFPTGKPGKPYFTAAFRLSLERFNDQFRTVSNHRLERFQTDD